MRASDALKRVRKALPDIEAYVERYDSWYERHAPIYRSELAVLRRLVPREGIGLEVGVGTGRFAAPLNISIGLDPSLPYLQLAKSRGVEVVRGVGELLPFRDNCLDYVALILVLAFAEEPSSFLEEAYRVLKPGGSLIACIIPAESPWGRYYQERGRRGHPIFQHIHLITVHQLEQYVTIAGFRIQRWISTLYTPPGSSEVEEPPKEGRRDGSFVALLATKPLNG